MKKLSSKARITVITGLGITLGFVATGCMTGQNETLDAITGTKAPYVEAFIEYRGPEQKWAGPADWTMHVTAKEGDNPQIVVPPSWTSDMAESRRPASQRITGEEARTKLGDLASAMTGDHSSFHGCLYPIHVRLISADGNILDKEGCRGQSGWAKAASGAVDFFIAAVK